MPTRTFYLHNLRTFYRFAVMTGRRRATVPRIFL